MPTETNGCTRPGATIIAHENTQKRLSSAQYVADWVFDFPPPAAGAIPTEVFSDARSLKLNDTTLALKYYGPAHTDGDISVYFAEADVLHTGDTLWNGIYPFIDYSTGEASTADPRRKRQSSPCDGFDHCNSRPRADWKPG